MVKDKVREFRALEKRRERRRIKREIRDLLNLDSIEEVDLDG